MKINTLLSVFAPQDTKFIPLLQETSSILVQTSIYLHELFQLNTPESRIELCKLIKAEEVKGDRITGRIFKALNDTFITPFDREDIHALADEMDDVIDAINRSAQKVLLYSPQCLPESTRRLSEIVLKGSKEIQAAVQELSKMKRNDQELRLHCKNIKQFEEDADVVYEVGIMTLFKEETDTVELIKLKEIIQELEKSANKINNVGKLLKTILVKYA